MIARSIVIIEISQIQECPNLPLIQSKETRPLPNPKIHQNSNPATTKEAPVGFTPPDLEGLQRKAQVEWRSSTWESPKEQVPKVPKLVRKEQCLELGTRLRSKYQFYRVFPFPNGTCIRGSREGESVETGRGTEFQIYWDVPLEVKFTGKDHYNFC